MCKRVKSNRMLNGCVHNETFDLCESVSPRDFAPPRVWCNCVFLGSKGSGGGEEKERERRTWIEGRVASPYQPHGDAVADLMKARALSFNKRARTTYRPIRRAPRGQIDGVITESGSVFLREMAASGRDMIISANKREILDLLPYRPYAVEVDGTSR